MKILAPMLAGAAAALCAYAVIYAGEPSRSAVATPVLRAFLAVFIAGVVLSALASRADRRREDRGDW